MTKRVALFPGQGAQAVGMAADFMAAYPSVTSRFEEASEVLGRDLGRICREGPEAELNATDVCQSALLVSSLAIFEVLERELGWKDWTGMAGLSLGEITALAAAGSLGFADAVRLTSARGRFMQEACDKTPSGMLSLIGMTRPEAEALAAEVRGAGVLVVANINAETQMVLSGEPSLLQKALVRAGELGKKAIPLKVAGAFHSPLMKPADSRLKELMASLDIKSPRVTVWSNVDGLAHTTPDEIRRKLSLQVVSPVLWVDCMKAMPADATYCEIGVGRVLSGLLKKHSRSILVSAVNTVDDLQKLKEARA